MTRAHGEGSVFFDGARGRWVGQAPPVLDYRTGKMKRSKIVGAAGETKASVAKRLRVLIDETSAVPGSPETVGELVDLWRDLAAPKKQSDSTLRMTDSLIAVHIHPVFNNAPVEALTVDDVEAFLSARVDTLSKSTLGKLRSIIAKSYDFGIRREYTQRNPARVAEMPAGARITRQGRALTSEEADLLLKSIGVLPPLAFSRPRVSPKPPRHRQGAWVVVALTLGLRPGEVSGLVWDAIDYGPQTLTVYQSLGLVGGKPVLKPTKTGDTRKLQMPEITAAALTEHQSVMQNKRRLAGDWPDEWERLVFLSAYGRPLDRTSTRKMVQEMATAAGIEGNVTSYDLRHTATTLMSEVMSAEKLADLLGHKDTSMVHAHYRHPDTATITTAVEYWDGR